MSNQAGKGDAPRNLGPNFRENYDGINWHREVKREKNEESAAEKAVHEIAAQFGKSLEVLTD